MKLVDALSRVISYLAMAVVAAMMLLTVADVFMRFSLNQSITGTVEITKYMMVCLLLGMALCALQRRHIKVDIVMNRFRPRIQAVVDGVTYLAGLVIVAVFAWQGFEAALYALSYDRRSSMLSIPDFPFHILLVLSFAMLFLVIVPLFIKSVAEAVKG